MKAGKAYQQKSQLKTKGFAKTTTIDTTKMTGRQQYKIARSAEKTKRLGQNLRAEQIRAAGQAAGNIVSSAITPSALRESGDIVAKSREKESAKQMNEQMEKWLSIMTSNPDKETGDDGTKNNSSPSSGSKLGG